jgi:DNA-directed RNA polymerase subunit omega
MNAALLHAAEKIVSNNNILINVVRRRVRQLTLGRRPLVVAPPGSGTADIALMEVIQEKISFAPAVEASDAIPLPAIVEFPDVRAKEKAA